jgi:hypothetical protein
VIGELIVDTAKSVKADTGFNHKMHSVTSLTIDLLSHHHTLFGLQQGAQEVHVGFQSGMCGQMW